MFEVEYYETADGRIPVKEFLDSLPKKLRDKAMYSLKLLYEYGNTLREPYSKYLGEGIFELRVKFSSDIIRSVSYTHLVGLRPCIPGVFYPDF